MFIITAIVAFFIPENLRKKKPGKEEEEEEPVFTIDKTFIVFKDVLSKKHV